MLFLIILLISLILFFSNFSFFVFIGFVPLFFLIQNKSPKKAFLISFIYGFLFYLCILYWLYHVTVVGLIVVCLYLALYFGIFGIIINRFGILIAPIAWIILEYIQANISILGFGWASLGYSQYKNLPLIQIADFSGVYGVSFIIMMVNVCIYMSLRGARHCSCGGRRSNPWFLSMACLILIASYAYGFFRLNEKNIAKNSIKVSVIQGNILQELKWDPDAQSMIIEKYIALTKMSALDNPDLLIWPETSFPGFFEIDREMTDRVLNLAGEINIPILIGTNTEKSLTPRRWGLNPTYAVEETGYFNSAVLVSAKGKIVDMYDKIHLVPFGEYVPFSKKIPVLHDLVLGELGEFTPGKESKIFNFRTPNSELRTKFGVLICFEDIFPELAKNLVKNGAQFLVVITNDAWYGKSPAAYQHAACSVFRAIENRVPIVRSANTGYSCFIDSLGRIYDSVAEKGAHLFVTGYKTSVIDLY
jgi:apolipoprotein N-acyltransferase